MMNIIWGALIVISVALSFINGTVTQTADAAMNGAMEAVSVAVKLTGAMCFWSGMMQIASDSGFTDIISKLLRPLTKVIFPKLKEDSDALKAIVMNLTANILGMSNAATPFGIKAVKELKKLSGTDTASDEMCMFIVINTASLQLIPSTVFALRSTSGSNDIYSVLIPVWAAGIASLTVGITAARLFERRKR